MVDNAAKSAMREKTTEKIVELYEMLRANSKQNSARGRRGVVNEVQMNNDMVA